jgi:hypothetical protein
MIRVAEHIYSRKKLFAYGTCVGVLAGMFNAFFPLIDFSMRASFFGWLAAAVVAIIFLHEGVHGAVAVLYGHRPTFGMKPPYFYTTFTEKIPRGHFIVITLAPLVVLNIIFIGFFAAGFLKVFTYFCLLVNTIGAMGDLWIILKLSGHDRGTLIQDTKNGIEVWNKVRG